MNFSENERLKNMLILLLAGAGLAIAQFIMVRDFVTILYGEEVVITLVTAAFFAGLSIGYLVSMRISIPVFKALFAGSVFLHLTFPFSYRYLAAYMDSAGVKGYGFLALLFVYAFIFSAMFSAILPRLVHTGDEESHAHNLKLFYTAEVIGFLIGFVCIGLTWNRTLLPLILIYWVVVGILIHLILNSRFLLAAYTIIALTVVFNFEQFDYGSSSKLYREKHGIKGANVLYSVNSPYQKVEVVKGADGTLYLYLDGLLNLNSSDLKDLNFFLAELPAMLVKPGKTLIVGNGTLSSVKKVSRYSGETVSVELDASVINAGYRFYTPREKLAGLKNWSLYNDDGKHFLKKFNGKLDLIIMDVPSPLTVQEAYLHTKEFYGLANEKLAENGVIAVQLSGKLQRNNRTPARITAALKSVFREVLVVYSPRADRGFAYASQKLPFSIKDYLDSAWQYDPDIAVYNPKRLHLFLKKAEPLSVDHMEVVLRRGMERFLDRYFD